MTDTITEQRCPPWCVNGADHLIEQLRRKSDFYHRGQITEIPTTETTPQLEPILAHIYLTQREQVDERGVGYRHPVEIVIEFAGGLLPDDADRLATVLGELAQVARSTTRDQLPGPEAAG